MPSVLAKPAQFERGSQHRRAMIGKIHVAKKQLMLDEDDYRQMLADETGQASLTTCSEAQLARFVDRLKAVGFKPLPPKSGTKPATANHPVARKARALWISLYHLGLVRNKGEPALEAFAARQLGCEKMVWARQSDGYRLIEALKVMATRNGWQQADAGGKPLSPLKLNEGLCFAILARLVAAGAVPENWNINQAAFRLCGIELGAEGPMTCESYARLAAALGRKLRDAAPVQGDAA